MHKVHVTEEMVNSMAQNGQITLPIIKGSKFAGGSKNLRNAGGSRITPSSSGNKGGSGKKGSSPKSSTPKKAKTEKTKEDKTDPYHMVNRALDDT